MRVVWITHNYPRHAGDPAGAFLHTLAVALRARDVDVQVIAPSEGGKGGDDVLDGVPVARVRYASPAAEQLGYGGMGNALSSPGGTLALARLRRALGRGAMRALGTSDRGLVHAHWWLPAGLAAPKTAPMVLTCHGTDVRLIGRFPPLRWIARPVVRRAAVVTTVSRALAGAIRRHTGRTLPDDAIQPMPVAPVTRPISDRSGGVVVIGRLSGQKRIDLALEAFALARRRGYPGTLTVAGDGPRRTALETRATADDLRGTVLFRGIVPPEEIPGLLATAAVALMPARGEGFGLAAAEALIQGVPVVACTDGGGLADIVPPAGAGRLVAPDAGALASALLDVVADPAAGAAAAAEGRGWSQRLSPDHVADRCLDWYHHALHA